MSVRTTPSAEAHRENTWTIDPQVELGVGFSGVLTLVGGRCFGVEQEYGGSTTRTVLVWPDDTQIERRGGALGVVTEGTFLRVGQVIEGGASHSYRMVDIRREAAGRVR